LTYLKCKQFPQKKLFNENPGQKENIMKKFFMLTVVLMVVFAVGAAQAEVRAGSFSITPFIGGYFFEGNENLKDTYTVGLRAGYNFTENVGLEAFFNYIPTELEEYPGEPRENLLGYGLEALIHFFPDGNVVPFIAVGVGGMHYGSDFEKEDKLTVDYGAGVKFFITDNVALRADVRHIMPLNDKYNDLLVSLGVNFAFGGKKKVYDSDQDGVFDDVDQCPDTPLGVKVDKDGCPIDSDNDGVPDYLDKCPGTPAGVVVDKDGCPLDSDKDGVPDYLDKCPGTPAGIIVDKDGCPLDSDKDGVPDYLDKCPGTPLGVKVDKDGCPIDSDKDGVPDYLDKCPGTPLGVKVDKDGCPPDTDKDGVPDYLDKCPNTPLGAKVDKDGCMREKITKTLNVQFDTAKYDIKPKYHDNIKEVADFMKTYPNTKFVIEGHTDNVGKDAYNVRLSQNRANSVKQYLIDKFGIDATTVEAVGYGPSRPVADNSTPEGKQKNRRVDAVLETVLVR